MTEKELTPEQKRNMKWMDLRGEKESLTSSMKGFVNVLSKLPEPIVKRIKSTVLARMNEIDLEIAILEGEGKLAE